MVEVPAPLLRTGSTYLLFLHPTEDGRAYNVPTFYVTGASAGIYSAADALNSAEPAVGGKKDGTFTRVGKDADKIPGRLMTSGTELTATG